MKKLLAAFLLCAMPAVGHAGTIFTPRIGLSSPTVGGFDYGPVLAADMLIIDSSMAVQGLFNDFISSNVFESTVTFKNGVTFNDATVMTSTTQFVSGTTGSTKQMFYNNAGTFAATGNALVQTSSITFPGTGGIAVTYGETVGSSTINNLSVNQFVKTNSNKNLVSGLISSTDLPGDVMYNDVYQTVTSSISISSYVVMGSLSTNQCVQTNGAGRLVSSGGSCGGGGGASSLQVTSSGVQITSPTASMNFLNLDFSLASVGSTATIRLNPATTDFIQNQTAAQSATFNVTSGTVTDLYVPQYLVPLETDYSSGAVKYIAVYQDPSTVGQLNVVGCQDVAGHCGLKTGAVVDVGSIQFGATGGLQTTAYPGSAGLIISTNVLQSGTTFYTSSGTANSFNATTVTLSSTSASTVGVIKMYNPGSFAMEAFIHAYSPNGSAGQNTFLGSRSGNFTLGDGTNSHGSWNTGVGGGTLHGLTNGNQNSVLGYADGSSITTGSGNTLMGYEAGNFLSTGSNNVGIGALSLFDLDTGSNNVAIGPSAGGSELGNGNTYIGSGAGSNGGTLTDAIVIGGGTAVSSYTAVLGNIQNFVIQGSTPTMGACGTSPSVVGTDTAGTITVGGGVVTSCALNFNQTWAQIPTCVVTDNNTAVSAAITSLSASTLTIGTSATLGGGNLYYVCIGRQ